MNENERHNIDETFRTKIEQMSMKPPTTNLGDVRANVLQRYLQNAQHQNRWLKGSLIAMTFLLGTCTYFLLNRPPVPEVKILVRNKYIKDTICLTQYCTKYVKVPVLIYPKFEDKKEQITKTVQSNNIINDDTFTDSLPNITAINDPLDKQREIADLWVSNNSGKSKSAKSQIVKRDDIESINVEINRNIQSKQQNVIDETSPNNELANKLTDQLLKSKNLNSDITWKKPVLKFKSPVKVKESKIRIPFIDRLSTGIYFSPEGNIADVRKDAIQAFGLGDEAISNSSSIGLRVGFKLSKKVSIHSGVELQTMNFVHQGADKEKVIAESGMDGKPLFFRHTMFGVALIPLTEMTANPQVGSHILIEGDKGHFIEAIRIPLSIKFQLHDWNFSGFGWRGAGLSLYGIGGGYFVIDNKQQLMVEIYEPDGHDFYTTLNNFKNTKAYTGLNFGIGGELSFGRNFQIFAEPYYQTTLTSLVKDMPIRTFVNGIGLKIGINYQFSKR